MGVSDYAQKIIEIQRTILIARFATTFATNLQTCYQKGGSFTALADLLQWMEVLLSVLTDLLRKLKNFRRTLAFFYKCVFSFVKIFAELAIE